MPFPALPLPGRSRHAARSRGGSVAAVVLAGGSGRRVGSALNKVYLPLAGRRVISWSLTWAQEVPEIGTFVLVVRPEDAEIAEQTLRREAPGLPVSLVVGGDTRHESEEAALHHLATAVEDGALDVVAIHDGARPLAGPSLWRSVIGTARAVGGAVPALPAGGVLGVGPGGHPVGADSELAGLTRVQTPQAFRAPELLKAYQSARVRTFQGTDTSSTMESHSEVNIQVVAGTRTNLKITYPHDLFLAEQLLSAHRYRLP